MILAQSMCQLKEKDCLQMCTPVLKLIGSLLHNGEIYSVYIYIGFILQDYNRPARVLNSVLQVCFLVTLKTINFWHVV